ncbi:MAG: hypothetical protein KQH63_11035 [Desulfobulbaceae bacterium]|nr:hypothetical protein [Desulfobulbaceae bacterium]
MDSDLVILDFHYKNKIFDERKIAGGLDTNKMFDLLPPTIIDKRTLQVIELQELYKTLNHTKTFVGSAKLFQSLMNPCESLELIEAKQDSLSEYEGNDKLRSAVEEYIGLYSENERALFKLLNAHIMPVVPYRDFKKAMKAVEIMARAAGDIPQPDTQYLDSLLQSIKSFHTAPIFDLVTRPTYRTLHGIMSRSEKKRFTPALKFRATRLTAGTIFPALPALFFSTAWFTGLMNPALAQSFSLLTGGGVILGASYGVLVKPFFDYMSAILPIRKRLFDSSPFASTIESVAGLDELSSFNTYAKKLKYPTVLPEVTDEKFHYFVAKELRNPVRSKTEEDFVGNDVSLEKGGVTFITGPNSGGKTTYCKTIVQNQILAQIGAPVVAKSAKINMCDRIFYQAPMFDSITDQEGRFGTELKTTRDIFFNTTPKSLAILDEIAEGTTIHEKMAMSLDILNGFFTKANTTLLVTHSFELVERFKKQERGQYLQVEFDGEMPTHQLIPGISTESKAERVAEKIGFSSEDIKRHLKEKGYIRED